MGTEKSINTAVMQRFLMRVESKQQFTEGVVSSGGLKIPQRLTIKEKILLSKEEN